MTARESEQGRLIRALRRRAVLAWSVALAALLALFLYRNQDDISRSIDTARAADPAWLLAIAALAVASQAGYAHVLWLLVRRLHPGLPWRPVGIAHLQRFGVSALAPLPGPGVVALTRSLRTNSVSTENCLLAVALEALAGHASLVIYLVPMLGILAVEGRVSAVLLGASGVLVLFSAAIGLVSAIALRPGGPPRVLARRMPARGLAFFEIARAHRVQVRDLAWPLVVALGINVTGAATMYAALASVGAEPTIAMAAAAYGTATLFLLVAPVFSGIGIVEVGAVVILRQFGLPAEQALSATILYRVAALWLPLVVALAVPVLTNERFRRRAG